MRLLAIALVLLGCKQPGGDESSLPSSDPPPMEETETEAEAEAETEAEAESPSSVDAAGVRWELTAEPTRLSMAQRADFEIRIAATNTGAETVDPQQHQGQFQLNGETHMGLNLWFGNGRRTMTWSELPAGETARDRRRPGEQLFEAPGTYEISYVHGSARASVTVTVTP